MLLGAGSVTFLFGSGTLNDVVLASEVAVIRMQVSVHKIVRFWVAGGPWLRAVGCERANGLPHGLGRHEPTYRRRTIFRMFRRYSFVPAALLILAVAGLWGAVNAQATDESDRARDGLIGPVRRVRTETAKLAVKGGKIIEGPRVLLETATYDIKGNKIDNAYYSVESSNLTGREVYKYDERGNITEMTLYSNDGTIVSREVYAYEFDPVGNWTKMTTSVAVIEGGKITYEPTEVTYRTITYFYEDNIAKIVQTSTQPTKLAPSASNASPTSDASATIAANSSLSSGGESANSMNRSGATTATKPVGEVAATPKAAPNGGANAAGNLAANGSAKRSDVPPAVVATLDKSVPVAPSAPDKVPVEIKAAGVRVEGDAPPPPAPKPLLKPISGGVLNGRAISLPKPIYPEAAKRARAQGVVNVEVVVDVSGRVISARAVSGPTLLHEAAVAAARQARFTPTLLSGQPVKVSGVITYNFVYEQ